MEAFGSLEYKETLKSRIKEIQKRKPSYTLKKLATLIPVQYTYLSKTLNKPEAHLNEDHLFKLCGLLELEDLERDFILLQRSHETTNDPERKEFLTQQIQKYRSEKLIKADNQVFKASEIKIQTEYLLNTKVVLSHVAMYVEKYRENPRILADKLGVTLNQLQDIFRVLAQNEVIEVGEDLFDVKEVKQKKVHFGVDHPFMRMKQNLMKTKIQSKLLELSDEEKKSFMVTFGTNEEGKRQIDEAFDRFIKEVQEVVGKTKADGVYQMTFDFFKWF